MNRLRLALAGVTAAVFMIGSSVVSTADPGAVERARQELERIQQQVSAIDQEIIEASDRAQQAEAKLDTLTSDLKAQEAKVAALSAQLGDVASLQLHQDSVSFAAQLLTTSDSSSFLSGLATLQTEIDRSNSGVQQLQLDQAKVTTLREDAEATRAQLAQDRDAKIKLSKDYEAKEAQAKAVYDRLSEEERQRLAALEAERQRIADEQQRAAEARQRAAEAASRSRTEAAPSATASPSSRASRSAEPSAEPTKQATKEAAPEPPAETGGSDRAQRAVEIALAQVGKRYVWGTSGPNTFDCSGFTSYAYRQVGINISRSSRLQWQSAGRKVSKSELKPGDLVFYYSPVSHVGLYIGNGKIVDAANPRRGVRVTGLNSMPFTGARRVVG